MQINWKEIDNDGFLELVLTEEKAFALAMRIGLIDETAMCDCDQNMKHKVNRQKTHGLQFVCTAPRSACSKKRSVLSGSFFARTRVSVRTAFKCIAAYASGLKNNQFAFYVGLKSKPTIVDWKNFFRDICAAIIGEQHETKIGGPQFTVEIDESLIYKRKNHVGRLLSNEITETWIFGGICRETSEAFIVPVPDRTTTTLLTELKNHVLPGTLVISDGWKAYREIPNHGYEYAWVNHTFNFIDPNDPTIHTQKVERMWRTLKSVIPKGSNTEMRWTYLSEFIFKQRYGWYSKSVGERIELIINNMKTINFNE